jgi:predicted Fe-S protein YdhL (DUF1289 family)
VHSLFACHWNASLSTGVSAAKRAALLMPIRDPSTAEPASPCTGVCRLNKATRICRGCRRTLAEIATWSTLTSDEKRAVLATVRSRDQ